MLLDTSGLLCLFDGDDWRHNDATTLFEAATRRLTHSYILAEFIALTYARGLSREATLTFVMKLQESPLVDVIYVDSTTHHAALDLLRRRLDKGWSLCDGVSFILM